MIGILRLAHGRRMTIELQPGVHAVVIAVQRRGPLCVCDGRPIDLGKDEPHGFCKHLFKLVRRTPNGTALFSRQRNG